LSLKQLADDVWCSLVGADVVHRDDIRMVERPGEARFMLEARQERAVTAEGLGHHLERHLALQARVLRPVDLGHPPSPEGRHHLVRTYLAAGPEAHGEGAYCCPTRWGVPQEAERGPSLVESGDGTLAPDLARIQVVCRPARPRQHGRTGSPSRDT